MGQSTLPKLQGPQKGTSGLVARSSSSPGIVLEVVIQIRDVKGFLNLNVNTLNPKL